jgi:hypothetical protein
VQLTLLKELSLIVRFKTEWIEEIPLFDCIKKAIRPKKRGWSLTVQKLFNLICLFCGVVFLLSPSEKGVLFENSYSKTSPLPSNSG